MTEKYDGRVLVTGELPDGSTTVLREDAEGNVHAGVIDPIQDGKPITGDLVEVSDEADDDGWRPMKVLYSASKGPPQVATKKYCEGYDRIFGKKKVGLA